MEERFFFCESIVKRLRRLHSAVTAGSGAGAARGRTAVSRSGMRLDSFTTGPSLILFTVRNTPPSVASATRTPTAVPTPAPT